MNSQEVFLQIHNVTKTFGSFVALDHVSMDVYPGELVCILGPSGCGKTTLLRIIAGLEEQNMGQIVLQGQDISRLPTSKRKFGMVFQSYALFPNLTAAENVAYGLKSWGNSKPTIVTRTQEMLDLVGLGDLGNKYPAQLSGGQQQRVALARALATSPTILLLDEPLSALDAQVRIRLRQEIRDLQQRLHITTIMVTHDQEEALTMADRVIVLDQGRLIQCATPQEIYHAPGDPFVAGFIGTMNFMDRWQVADASTVRCGNWILKTKPKAVAGQPGREVLLAIRPEDIRILDEHTRQENLLYAQVENIEFRGSFYRLRLRMQSDHGMQPPQIVDADVQSEILECHNIRKDQVLPVHLPSDRILLFESEHGEGTRN